MVEKIDCNGSQNLICTKKKIGNRKRNLENQKNRKFVNPEPNSEIQKSKNESGNSETNSEIRKLENPETNSENGKLRNPETNSEETNSEIDRISKNVRKI